MPLKKTLVTFLRLDLLVVRSLKWYLDFPEASVFHLHSRGVLFECKEQKVDKYFAKANAEYHLS